MKVASNLEDLGCAVRGFRGISTSRFLANRAEKRRSFALAFATSIVFGGAVAITVTNTAFAADGDIRLSGVGYGIARAKVASVMGEGTTFEVQDASTKAVAYNGTLSAKVADPDTGDSVQFADFSELTKDGKYVLVVPGVGSSAPFEIRDSVYSDSLVTAMLGFYGWRSGMKVEFDYGGQHFAQGPGHLQDGLLDYIGTAGQKRDGSRGWYDAGDYGKYTVNAGITLGMMLAAWEQFKPNLEHLKLNIPEQGGARPDFLDELAWEYDWLFTMQYSDTDGRVSHKLTSLEFAKFDLPELDMEPTYYSKFGSAATASFAATMAKGSRAFKPYDLAYADKMLTAAKLSYAWLTANPQNVAADIAAFSTGAYGTTDSDDRLWASAEMWEATGDAAILADLEKRISSEKVKVDDDFDWGNVKNLGMYTYALSTREGRDATILKQIQSAIVAVADGLVATRDKSGYGRALDAYYWGVNGSVARTCMSLMAANQIAPKKGYVDTCADQVAHLYGRNTFGRSFVTGQGKEPPLHPHHRPSGGDSVDAPFPGLLVGGPNVNSQCDALSTEPSKNWTDVQDDYCTNEVAINWNGALVYALAALSPALSPSEPPATGAGGSTATAPTSQAPGGATATPPVSTGVSSGGATSKTAIQTQGGAAALTSGALSNASTSANDEGCNCRTAQQSERTTGLLTLMGTMLGIAIARRRRQIR